MTEEDGARHTKWMKFMWPRLKVMRDLLKPAGVLAICIDGRELFHLGKMLDELFRPENRLAIINWEKSYSPRADNRHVSTATEYVLVYAKNKEVALGPAAPTALRSWTPGTSHRDGDPDGGVARRWLLGKKSCNRHGDGVCHARAPSPGELHYPPEAVLGL